MQIPQPHINIKVREVFRKIYNRGKIDLSASRNLLQPQLDLYLDHLEDHTGHKVPKKDRERIWNVIERNNQVVNILSSPTYKKIVERKLHLIKGTSLGFVFCIDGRIPAIFLGGRFARHFEIPAAELSTIRRKSDNKIIPDSSDLNEALRRISTSGNDLLEIVLAHTSLTDPHHGCGAMTAKKKAGLLDPGLTLVEANFKIIKEETVAAITNMYNEFRIQIGLKPLEVVAISALYDTDTFGIILNYDLEKAGKSLSTTKLTDKYKDRMGKYFIKDNIMLGSFTRKFTDLEYFNVFSKNILAMVEAILAGRVVPELLSQINGYLKEHFGKLTASQMAALRFVLIRNIALQYLTGSFSDNEKAIEHAFSEHKETYMAVAMRGMTIGKFDPQSQGFASTPADPKKAIDYINTMLSAMQANNRSKPYVLFVCNSVAVRDLQENNLVLQRIVGSNAGLLRGIIADKNLGEMIGKGELIPVAVLMEEESREVLKIVDHSGYI